MSTECPNCMPKHRADLAQPPEWREENGVRSEGYLHPSMEYLGLELCNCCGSYYRLWQGKLVFIPRRQLSDWRAVQP